VVSWAHIQAVRAVTGLTPAGRHVLTVLALHTDRQGRAWPAAATLADWTGMHRSSVFRLLAEIPKSTPVKVVHRPGQPSVFDLSPLVDRAPSATPTARPVTQKRAPSATQSVLRTDQGNAAHQRGLAASPNGSKNLRRDRGSVDYSRWPNWTQERLDGERAAPVVDLSTVIKRGDP
jgi:hypothetical protein